MAGLRRRQRGAAALFAAIGMVAMVAASAFAIDVVQLHIAKRDLQNMANLSALDAARAAGGCLAPDDPRGRQAVANQAVTQSLERLGGQTSWLSGGQVNLGRRVVDADGVRSFELATEEESTESYAFEVNLTRPFPSLLLPIPGVSVADSQMTARAASTMAPIASFRVGSFLANVGTGEVELLNTVLEGLLGADPGLTVAGAQGLVSSSVELSELIGEAGLDILDDPLSDPVLLPGALTALADLLFDLGRDAAGIAVDQIAAVAPSETILLGDAIPSAQDAVLGLGETSINTLDLVQALVQQVGSPVLALTPDIAIPGVFDIQGDVNLGEPPTLGAGPAVQDSSGNFLTGATNTVGDIVLDVDLLPLLGDTISLRLELELVEARADLLEIRCADRTNSEPEVTLGIEPTLATLQIKNDGSGPDNPPLVNLLGLIQICATSTPVQTNNGAAPGYIVRDFVGPFDPEDPDILADNTQVVGAAVGEEVSDLLDDVIDGTTVEFCPGSPTGVVLNLLLSPILTALGLGDSDGLLDLVDDLLADALGEIVDPLLMPLLQSLGVSLAGAEVTVTDLEQPGPILIDID